MKASWLDSKLDVGGKIFINLGTYWLSLTNAKRHGEGFFTEVTNGTTKRTKRTDRSPISSR